MKQPVENQIKHAFDNWDTQENNIGFDKAAVWQSIAASNQASKFNWLKVAVIIFVFFLTGALAYTINENQSLKIQNEELSQRINNQTEKIVFRTDTVIKREVEIRHQIVEKQIDNTKLKEQLNSLSYQNQLLSKENFSLRKEMANHNQEKETNIQQLDKLQEQANKIVHQEANNDKPKASQQLKININREALMAISKDEQNLKSNHPVNGKKLIFSITSKPDIPETSAPFFRNFNQ